VGSSGPKADTLFSLPVTQLTIASIRPSKFKLRRELGELTELKESIARVGLLQPIIVRKESDSRYEVVSGHRRLASCRELGMEDIRAIIADINDKAAFEIQLTENIQRESFTPLEEARAFYSYVRIGGKRGFAYGSVSELARSIGKSQEYVSSRMRLLRLPCRLLERMLSVDGFTVSHAEEIALLAGDPVLVEELSNTVITKKLTVRELERAIPLIKAGTGVDQAIELAKREIKLNLKWERPSQEDDPAEVLLRRTINLLESTLSYIDNASSEIEMDRALYDVWINEVRLKVHDAVDGAIFCEKIRRGRVPSNYRRTTDQLFIWSG